MTKVLWITQSASPYKRKLFLELNKYFELTILLLNTNNTNRNKDWFFDYDNLKVLNINKNYRKIINDEVINNNLLINSIYSKKEGIYATKAFNKNNKTTIMHADGGIPQNRGFVVNKIMSLVMKKHDYFLSSSKYTDRYFNYYGIEKNIYHYRFTSLTQEDMERHKKMSSERNKYREKLGIDKYTVLSVGQPIYRKGYDLLVRAIKDFKDKKFIVIGGKPMDEVSKYIYDNNITNIKFVGLLNPTELEEYYAACDAFILPTREDIWGLVINEALSFNLPIITSDNCVAGLHFKDNCTIVKNEDVEGYKDAIENLKIEKDNYSCIKDYTIENSALDINNALKEILENGYEQQKKI